MGWWGFGIYLDGFNNEPSDRTMYCIIPNPVLTRLWMYAMNKNHKE